MPKSNSPLFPPAAVPELKVRQLLLPTIPVLLLLIDNRPLLGRGSFSANKARQTSCTCSAPPGRRDQKRP